MEKFRLNNLPGYGKVFVGVFTALMLAVCFWAAFIVYYTQVEEFEDSLSEAVTSEVNRVVDEHDADMQRREDAGLLAEDSDAVLAPIWDSTLAGEEIHEDSVTNLENFRQRDEEMAGSSTDGDNGEHGEEHEGFEHHLGLAHVHVNGQTLLFFAIGLIFLFSSVSTKFKKVIFWFFGIAVFIHPIGLAFEEYGEIYEILLFISGTVILLSIAIMALFIFLDLRKKPA